MSNHHKLAIVEPDCGTRLKWPLFRTLEWAAGLRMRLKSGPSAPREQRQDGLPDQPAQQYLWVFVTTIGEVNAIQPFLDSLLSETGPRALLLISNHVHYREAYLAKYPKARFTTFQGSTGEIERMIEAFPPQLLIIAEIPVMLSDAPCRFSFTALYQLKRRRVPVCVVNGWLYHYSPASKMDWIEKQFFDQAYVRLIDLYMVQTDAVRRKLVATGANPDAVAVTGNIKFDAVTKQNWLPDRAKSPGVLRAIQSSGQPCIVAGCVTEADDQIAILDAFTLTRGAFPDARLVLAPRHPEVRERMQKLESFLQQRQFSYVFKTRLDGDRLDPGIEVLVLDTMGELRDFYAVATLAYVGADHNVLEPLAFDKPVFVRPGWEATYPSYPVYHLLLGHGALIEVQDADELGRQWIDHLRNPGLYQAQRRRIDSVLERERGAGRRCLDLLAARGLLQMKKDIQHETVRI